MNLTSALLKVRLGRIHSERARVPRFDFRVSSFGFRWPGYEFRVLLEDSWSVSAGGEGCQYYSVLLSITQYYSVLVSVGQCYSVSLFGFEFRVWFLTVL